MADTVDDIVLLYRSVIESDMTVEEKKEYLDEIRKLKPAGENRWNLRFVIWAISIVALSSPLAILVIFFSNDINVTSAVEKFPTALIALSSTALGALAAYITTALKK